MPIPYTPRTPLIRERFQQNALGREKKTNLLPDLVQLSRIIKTRKQ